MFWNKKSANHDEDAPQLDALLDGLVRNEISITLGKAEKNGSVTRSRFGGKPAVPAGFRWPHFLSESFEGVTADRPLSFLFQVNLEEIHPYDKEKLLPEKGLLLFFYEQESMCWGFDPKDEGCSRVYYFEDTEALAAAEFPEELDEDYRGKEFDITLSGSVSYPSFEELECHSDAEVDWEEYDEALEGKGYELECSRHKLLGYADPIQGEMLTECERTARGLYCGDAESYQRTTEAMAKDIKSAATDWVLLFQMASIEDGDYELIFGDCGNLYFYIRKQDLKQRRFDRSWLILQCD